MGRYHMLSYYDAPLVVFRTTGEDDGFFTLSGEPMSTPVSEQAGENGCREKGHAAAVRGENALHPAQAVALSRGSPYRTRPPSHAFRLVAMPSPLALQSSRTAAIDRLRAADTAAATQALGVVGFTLLTALGAQIRFLPPGWEVPITFQTLAVYGSGLFLGSRNGALAQLLYLALGLFLPVFQGDGHGLAYFAGTYSAGYLLAYPLSAAAIGYLSKRWKTLPGSVLALVAGSAVLFATGVTWLHYAAGHASWMTSIQEGWLSFAAIDLLKMLVVAFVYTGMRRF